MAPILGFRICAVIASALLPRPAGHPGPRSLHELLPTLGKAGEHGRAMTYRTPNTDVLAWVLARVSGRSPAQLLEERLWSQLGAEAEERSGATPEFLIEVGETREAIKKVAAADPDIKILVLAAAVGGRGPGPLVSAMAKDGVGFSGRKLPVTVVPGDLSDAEIEDLA